MTERTQGVDPAQFGLRPGMTVEVLTLANRLVFMGKVESVRGGAVVIRDSKGDELPQVMYNQEIKLSFKRDGENTMLQGKVCGSTNEIWKLDQMESMFTKDQRASFRQSISTSVLAKCHRRLPMGELDKKGTYCEVMDVSAGGLMFSSTESYAIGDWLVLTGARLIQSQEPFSFNCQVRRVGKPKNGSARYGCKFGPMTDREQDRLLRAIFAIQREEIRTQREKGQL